MTASETTFTTTRKRRVRRVFAWAAGIALCLAVAGVVVRAVLIRQMRLQHTVLIQQMRLPRLTIIQDGDVMAVAVTPDGKTIFTGDDPTHDALRDYENKPADVFVWSAVNGRLLRRLHGFYWRSSGVTTSPDGRQVVASGEAYRDSPGITLCRAIAWNWRSGKQQWDVEGNTPLSHSPDGRFVGSANSVFNAATGKLICRTSKQMEEEGQSEFTPDGKLFGIIDAGTLNIDAGTLNSITRKQPDHDGKLYYSTTRLHFWRTDTGKQAKDFPFIRVRAFDIARNGQWLVMTSDADGGGVGSTDGSVARRVDFNTGKVVWTRERRENEPDADPESVLNSVAVSPNEKYVVLASINSNLIVLDARTGRELFRAIVSHDRNETMRAFPGGLAFSADGKTLVSRCGRRVLVWDASVLQ